MARFAAKYTPAQKAVILRLILERGMTAPEAVTAAMSDTIDGVPPFRMPVGTARDLAGRARRRDTHNRLHGGPLAALDEAAAMLARGLTSKVKDLARRPDADWEECRSAARAIAEVERLLLAHPERHPDPPTKQTQQRSKETPELVAQLRRLEENRAAGHPALTATVSDTATTNGNGDA